MDEISVVVPLFNKGKYVKEALDSVFAQTSAVAEVIIVDDGSTDDGPDIVNRLNDARVRLMSSGGRGLGPSVARNRGLESATSNWIAFLDADDFWTPTHITDVKSLIALDPHIVAAFTSWNIDRLDGHPEQEPTAADVGGNLKIFDGTAVLKDWVSRHYCPMWTSAITVNKKCFEGIGGFNEVYRRGEDKEAWLRLLLAGKVGRSSRPSATYRLGIPGQAVSSFRADLHPVSITVHELLSQHDFADSVADDLKRLNNGELWKYAKLNRWRAPLDPRFLSKFFAKEDPKKFLLVAAIFAASQAARLPYAVLKGR